MRQRLRPNFVLLVLLALPALIALALPARPLQAQGNGAPLAAFELGVDAGTVPLIVTTTNTSLGADSFRWDFGDGALSTETEPVHLYTRPGLFVVELQACRGADCATAIAVVNVEGRDDLDGGAIRSGIPVYGSIDQPGDSDRWTFLAEAGSSVTVHLDPDVGSPLDPILRLFGSDGALVAYNDDGSLLPGSEVVDVELDQTGEYTIEASGFLDSVGIYALQLAVWPPDGVRAAFHASHVAPFLVAFSDASRNALRFSWTFGDGETSTRRNPRHQYAEAGDYIVVLLACRAGVCDQAQATVVIEADDGGVISSGTPLTNRIHFEDDVDRFTFEAPAGAEVTIDLVATADAFDTMLFLFGPDGVLIAQDDDGGNGLNSRLEGLTLRDPGTYSIDALAFPGGGGGEYTLTLLLDPAPLVRVAVAVEAASFVAPVQVTFRDASLGGPTSWTWRLDGAIVGRTASLQQRFETPGTFMVELEACNARSCDGWSVVVAITAESDGGTMAANQTQFGAIDAPGDSDDWRFQATSGQLVTVRALALGGELDLTLELLGPDGVTIAFDDDSGGNLQPLIDGLILPATGEYVIRVRSFDKQAIGAYRLDLALAAEPG